MNRLQLSLVFCVIATLAITVFLVFDQSTEPSETLDPRTPNETQGIDHSNKLTSEGNVPQPSENPKETSSTGFPTLQIASNNTTPLPDGVHWRQVTIGESPNEYQLVRIERIFQGDPEQTNSKRLRESIMVANRILVQLSASASESELLSLATAANCTLEPISSSAGLYAISIDHYSNSDDLPKAISLFNEFRGIVEYSEPDYLISTSIRTPNDPKFSNQWGMQHIGSLQGWSTATSATNQIVAVIDTGINPSHVDLTANLWSNTNDIPNGVDDDGNGIIDDHIGFNAIDDSGEPTDEWGHGTAVAGIIGAVGNNSLGTAGVAWDVQLMSLKFIGPEGTRGRTSDAIKCIDYAIANGASVINASWGSGDRSEALKQAITRANEADILFVAAAGNDRQNIDSNPYYPAGFELPNVLAVAATNRRGELASFSNYGAGKVHIGAPGEGIYAPDSNGIDEYSRFSGTSFAAPFVSGAAALLLETSGDEAPQTLRDRIMRSAKPLSSLSNKVASGGTLALWRILNNQEKAPPNDDFENAEILGSNEPNRYSNLEHSTIELDEPNPYSSDLSGSSWYKLTAPYDATISIKASSGLFSPQLAAYTGSAIDGLSLLKAENGSSNDTILEVSLQKDQIVFIQISGSETTGPFSLKLRIPPLNDTFEAANPIDQDVFRIRGSNRFATAQKFEPEHGKRAYGLSTWWKFTATKNGPYFVSTFGSDTDTIIGIYQGSSIEDLSLVAANDNFNQSSIESGVQFETNQNETYYIAIDSATRDGGGFTIIGQYVSEVRFLDTPQNTTTIIGASAALSGNAVGPPPIRYQWIKNGEIIPGAIQNQLLFDPVVQSDFAEYQLQAASPGGAITSPVASISEGGSPPTIVFQPHDVTILTGESRTIRVWADGGEPLNFQWFRNSAKIPGATRNELEISQAAIEDSGSYTVSVSNNLGHFESDPITVRVGSGQEVIYNWVYPRDQYGFVTALASYGNRFYAGGGQGQILESYDGISWTETENFGEYSRIRSIQTIGTKLLATSDSSRLHILDTPDGPWRHYDFPGSEYISQIVFMNGKTFAQLYNDIYSSSDCITWELSHSLPDRSGYIGLATANGAILAMKSGDSTTTLARSIDGVQWETWEESDIPRAKTLHGIRDQFYLYANNQEWTSSNATDWTHQGNTAEFNKLIEIDGELLGQKGSFILRRLANNTWEPAFESYDTLQIAQKDERIIIGPHLGALMLFDSFDSIVLGELETDEVWEAEDFKFIGNQLIGYGDHKTGVSSGDLQWKLFETQIRGIAYGNNNFVAAGNQGILIGASIEHLEAVSNTSCINNVLAFGNDTFIASGNEGLSISSDGRIWEIVNPNSWGFSQLIFALDRFIGIDSEGNSYESVDGRTWTIEHFQDPFNGNYPVSISGDSNIVYSLTSEGQLYSKTKETDWILVSTLPNNQYSYIDIAFGNGSMVATTSHSILYSDDASNWIEYPVASIQIDGVAFGKDSFLAYGPYGELIQILKIDGNASNPPKVFTRNIPKDIFAQPFEKFDFGVDAYDLDGNVEKVQFQIDSNPIDEVSQPPYSTQWTPNSDGVFNLSITAIDNEGLENLFVSKIHTQSPQAKDLLESSKPSGAEDVVYHFGSIYVLSPSGSIYRTTDFEHWALAFEPSFSLPISLYKTKRAIIAASIGVSYRTENGYEWSVINTGNESSEYIRKTGDWLVAEDHDFDSLKLRSKDGLNWQSYDGSSILASNVSWSVTNDSPQGKVNVIDASGTSHTFPLPITDGHVYQATSNNGRLYLTIIPSGNPANATVISTIDFESWETIETPQNLSSIQRFHVNNGLHYIASDYNAFVSVDLESWTPFHNNRVQSIQYLNGAYYAFAKYNLYHSENGIDWRIASSGIGDRFLATPAGFLSWESEWGRSSMWKSQNSFDWEYAILSDDEYQYKSIAYGNGLHVALGRDKLAISTDGVHFEIQDKPQQLGEKLAFGNGKFLCLSPNHTFATSTDGVNWTYTDRIEGARNSERIFYLPPANGFVIQSQYNNYQFSNDGENWETRAHIAETHREFHHVKDLLFAQIGHPEIYVSSNAQTWTHIEALQSSTQIAYWDGYYYGIGDKGTLLKSADGIAWETSPRPSFDRIEIIEPRDDGILVGTGIMNGYEYFHSSDGTNWTKRVHQNRPGTPKVSNEIVFFLSRSISRKTFEDLSLESVTIAPQQYSVGNAIEGNLLLRNNSSSTISFDSLNLDARLGNNEIWLGNYNRTLESITVGPGQLEPGETASFQFSFNIPNEIEPGLFGLNVAINLDQAIPEITISNNHAWTGNDLIDIPERSLTFQSSSGGEIIPITNRESYAQGATVNLLASPYRGFSLISWQGVNSSAIETATVILDTDKTVSATFTQSFASWIKDHFSVSEHSSLSTVDYSSDPDNDGFSNLSEYWFDSSPTSADKTPRFSLYEENEFLCLKITKSTIQKEYELIVHRSSNATDWTPSNITIEKIQESDSLESLIYKAAFLSDESVFLKLFFDPPGVN